MAVQRKVIFLYFVAWGRSENITSIAGSQLRFVVKLLLFKQTYKVQFKSSQLLMWVLLIAAFPFEATRVGDDAASPPLS